ncbi:MAG: ubiquitin-like small modifier protein 1 [Candidatus Bipolaricaulia bacterium]
MGVTIRIPTPLRKLTGGEATVTLSATTVGELLEQLEATHPDLRERLRDEDGSLRHFLNVYVNDEDVRYLNGLETTLADGDEISLVPAVAGGRDAHASPKSGRGERRPR